MRIVKSNSIFSFIYRFTVSYPSPSNFNYFWGFGFLALMFLLIQIATGIFVAMHYIPNVDLAFFSVEHIMRDVNYGWLLRYLHSNGASMFFIVVYLHIFRGLYYGSYIYPRHLLWLTGVSILLLMILTAFMGYVLPWGQMSFWAATVITNFLTVVPYFGKDLVQWVWGGYSVNNATLNRFFSLHYLFPFLIFALSLLHLILLHNSGSNNPLGVNSKVDTVPFTPYYLIKDFYGISAFFIFFSIFVFFMPNYLGHPDNYILANPMVTPPHIVPEWYFLPFYAILRSVPNKLLGVLVMVLSIIVLFFLPFFSFLNIRSNIFKPLHKLLFWFFLLDCLILGWVGGKPVETPYTEIGQFATFFYFFYFLFLLPLVNFFEKKLIYFYNFVYFK